MDQTPSSTARIISLGSGKGGVGKSLISANLAVQLTMMKKKVIVIDADFGGSNLHTYLGLSAPNMSLSNIFTGTAKSFSEIMIHTQFENLQFISADSDFISITNFKYTQKMKILNEIYNLKADYIIIDLAAGSSYNVIDFFLASYFPIVITTPELASFENAYTFIKNSLFRYILNELPKNNVWYNTILEYFIFPSRYNTITIEKILEKIQAINVDLYQRIRTKLESFTPNLVLNRISEKNELRLGEKMKLIVQKYLSVDLHFLAYFEEDRLLRQKMNYERPISEEFPITSFSNRTRELAAAIVRMES